MTGAFKTVAGGGEARLDIADLARWIETNRFMPEPSRDTVFVGDGDYRAIGAEFLRHVVEIGGLQPDARFLDIGCGIGRLAVPLTQYLNESGSYHGFDPVRRWIDWCNSTIRTVYPRFHFHHLDLRHVVYNPDGKIDGGNVTLPFPESSFDFAVMISVLTHLPASEARRYASEAARVLAPGGTLFATAFLAGVAGSGKPRLAFAKNGESPEWFADASSPLSAVAFEPDFLEATFAAAGFRLRLRQFGHWRGIPAPHYQDLLIFERESPGA